MTKAAEYVRMSTDHQKYSTANQSALIHSYADAHGMEIVRTYADSGKSGLTLDRRAGLASLIADVLSGGVPFSAILVYDVSRWGRFQDVDESAHYEFICRSAGIRVIYCAEQFPEESGPFASLLKAMKRVMAGEYSRELSAKVFAGQARLSRLGFRQGGSAGYGLRRQLLEGGVRPGALLRDGQRKAIQTDRVVLVPGPSEECATVRRIYREFIYAGRSPRAIADALNDAGLLDDSRRAWNRYKVTSVLSNEKYVGNLVYAQLTARLKGQRTRVVPEEWIRCDRAYQPVIDPHLFEAAQRVRQWRARTFSDEQILKGLRGLWDREGMLTGELINAEPGLVTTETLKHRFGGLAGVYRLLGYTPDARSAFRDTDLALREMKHKYEEELFDRISARGLSVSLGRGGVLKVDGRWSIEVVAARCRLRGRKHIWRFKFHFNRGADLLLAVRMDYNNARAHDFLLIPRGRLNELPLFVHAATDPLLAPFRHPSIGAVTKAIAQLARKDPSETGEGPRAQ